MSNKFEETLLKIAAVLAVVIPVGACIITLFELFSTFNK